ncbi:MAG TPA: hypothetical protein VF587_08390 [Solirubrobacteraceae bacterium]|jgi:hypothetical protein
MRPRRVVPGWLIALLRPLFRYSDGRHAYVLRLGGGRSGPVLQTAEDAERAAAEAGFAPSRPAPTGRFTRDETELERPSELGRTR